MGIALDLDFTATISMQNSRMQSSEVVDISELCGLVIYIVFNRIIYQVLFFSCLAYLINDISISLFTFVVVAAVVVCSNI